MYQSLMRNRNFNLFFTSSVLSKAGTSLSGIAFLLLVYNETHSVSLTTGVVLVETLPYALFGLLGGVIADTLSKKRMLVILNLVQGMILITSFTLYTFHELTYPVILGVLFLVETAGCFYNPASRAVLPLLIHDPDRVVANSLMDISSRGTLLIGPAAAYFLLHWVGYGTFFWADGISYLLGAALIGFIQIPVIDPSDQISKSKHFITGVYKKITDFSKFAWKVPDLRKLFITTTVVVFFHTWVWQVGLLLKAELLFQDGQQFYSIYLICFSVFSIIVSLLLPLRYRTMGIFHYMYGAALWGIGIFCIGLGQNHFILAGFSSLIGIGIPITSLSRVFLLQTKVPESMRGLGFSFSAVLLYFSNITSLAIFGALSHFISVPILFEISGICIVMIAGVYLLLMKFSPLRRRGAM